MSCYRTLLAVTLLGSLSGFPAVAKSSEINGSARVFSSFTNQTNDEIRQIDQRYTFNLRQPFTPYLSLTFSYRFNDLDSRSNAVDFKRRSQEPLLALIYQRPGFTGQLSYQDRKTRGSSPSENFNQTSLAGLFSLQPRVGPMYSLSFRDDTNFADVAVFGRDVRSKTFDFSTDYSKSNWHARYSFHTGSVENPSVGFRLDEDSNDLRAGYNQSFWGDLLGITADTWVSRRHQIEQSSADAAGLIPVLPVPVRQGLFAVDTSPDIGELVDSPGLVDGDTQTPVEPRIDIGGASTFRNLGVDLGFTRPVSRLEITVDTLSGTDVIWEVYHGPDNLNWARVDGVTAAEFDGALLRYTLRFPATTDRFFKAVNVTPNSVSAVAVTEIRPLVEATELGNGDGLSTIYRADLSASLEPHERITGVVRFSLNNEEDLAGTFLRRDLAEMTYSALLRVEATSDIDLRLLYRFSNIDETQDRVLQRDIVEWTATLDYDPLPTLDAQLSLARRDERDRDQLIRSIDTIRARVLTDLLPNLSLISEIAYSLVEDPFSGFASSSWRWRETLESRLTERFVLQGSLSQTYFDSTGVVVLTRRTRIELRALWSVTPFLSFTGNWAYAQDDNQTTLTPTLALSWRPGPKVNVTLSYQGNDSRGVRRTSNVAARLNYWLNPKFNPFAVFSRSTSETVGVVPDKSTTLRVGFNFFF